MTMIQTDIRLIILNINIKDDKTDVNINVNVTVKAQELLRYITVKQPHLSPSS